MKFIFIGLERPFLIVVYRLDLIVDKTVPISAVAVHTDSVDEECRVYEIQQYWKVIFSLSAKRGFVDPNLIIEIRILWMMRLIQLLAGTGMLARNVSLMAHTAIV